MRKRLAIDVRLAGTGGGISRYMDGMIAGIMEQSNYDDVIFYGNQERSPYEGAAYKRVAGSFLSYYGWHLPNALRRDAVDALFAPSAFLPLRRVCHTVTVLYDLYALKYDSLLARSEARSYRGMAYRARAQFHLAALRKADVIVSISQSTANDLRAFSPTLAARQEVVYCDVPAQFRASSEPRGRFILYVGGFNTHKNVAALVRAHALLNKNVAEPVRLVLAGYHGWPPVDLEGIVAAEGRPDLVTIELRPSDERIIELYQRCAVFAYISAYEGFGLPVLEAIRCGAPVLVNDASSLPELAPFVDCRVDARSIDSISQRLQRLIESDQSVLVDALQKHAEQFSFARSAGRVLELLGNGPPARDFAVA